MTPSLHRALAERLRDWIHETPLSRCDAGSDTCEDWLLANELATMVVEVVRKNQAPIEVDKKPPLGRIPYLPAHNHNEDQVCNRVTCPLGSWMHYQNTTENDESSSGDPWKEVDRLREELRTAKLLRAEFADFAEAFCSGWNRRRSIEDMAYSDNPDVFQRQIMEAYRNSGGQRALRFLREFNRREGESVVETALRRGASIRSGE